MTGPMDRDCEMPTGKESIIIKVSTSLLFLGPERFHIMSWVSIAV